MKRTRLATCLMIAFLFIFTLAQFGGVYAETPRHGGFLKVATDSTAVGLDPHLSITFSTFTFTEHVYETLYTYDPEMNLAPSLAVSHDQLDDLTYIFYLREGVMFHHGREMTADDVKFTLDRMVDPEVGAPRGAVLRELIDEVIIIDDYTVQINLKNPSPELLDQMANVRYSAIIPRDVVEKEGNLQRVMVGTGPFKLDRYEHGVRAVFSRNDDYWDGDLPYLDGFELVVIADEMSRIAALRRGAIDIGWVKELIMAVQAERTIPDIRIIESESARMGWFTLNVSEFPFNVPELRQAVSAAIDRQAIIDTVLHGFGVWSTIIPPANYAALSQEEIKALPFHQQDYDLARELMAKAGYPNGFEFTVKTSPHSPDYVPACEMIQDQLARVGIKMNIEIMEWGVFQTIRRETNFQANFFASSWRGEPSGYYYPYMHGNSPSNEIGMKVEYDPYFHELLEKTIITVDDAQRLEYLHELQHYTAEQAYRIITYAMPSRMEMVKDYVKGYSFMANNGRQFLKNAWIDK